MDEIITYTPESIGSKIYTVRGIQIMLDRDLAVLYQVTTGNLNKAVKRNLNRFPSDFMFQLTKEEWERLRFQIGTSNIGDSNLIFQNGIPRQHGGNRFLPYAFTEHGVITLAAVLKSDIAVAASIAITRAFVQMRQTLARISDTNLQIEQLRTELKQVRIDMQNILIEQNDILQDQNEINESVRKQQDSITKQLESINNALAELQADKNQQELNKQRNPIGFVKPNKP